MIAVIMCGGMGTRMRPITDIVPKPLLQIGGREILDILIEKLTAAGVDTIYLTLGYMGDEIQNFIDARQYNVDIIPVFENTPLGTAGGVRNAIKQTMDDIVILSGDNIFSFDIKQSYHEHLKSEAAVSLIGIAAEDPRDYGTVLLLDDGTITSFIEKPSWTQVESDIINTGIYFMNGEILSLIPENKMYDFASDLFPLLLSQQYPLHCILADGKWGDLGDIKSYLDTDIKVLNGDFGCVCSDEKFIKQNKILPNGTIITAPCVIDKKATIGAGCSIGPHTVIGADCVIGDNCNIEKSIISDNCDIENGTVCNTTFLGKNCSIGAFVRTQPYCVLAGNVNVRKFAVLENNCKINAGCDIPEHQIVNKDIHCNTQETVVITANGLQGIPLKNLTLQQALNIGCAIASCKNIHRVGISSDSSVVSVIFKNAVAAGLQACNATVYDFGDIIRCQRVFFSQYCKLDFFVSITLVNDELNISFSAKNAAPLSRKTERAIQAAYRYEQFRYASVEQCKELFFMNPMCAVYKSLLMNKLPLNKNNLRIAVECDNLKIYELMNEIIRSKGYRCDYGGLLFMIDKNGEKFYAVEHERAFSHDRILTICCNYELEHGSDIAISETAPGILELLSEKNGRHVTRFYDAENELNEDALKILSAHSWVFDGLMCIIRLLEIMNQTGKSLQQLSDELPDCYVKSLSFVYHGEAKDFRNKLLQNGAVKSSQRTGYYEWEDERGSVKVKADSACRNVKVLIEAESMEMSRELAADAEDKLKNCAIDKL